MQSAEAFLAGGAPTQKFPKVGFTWGGTVESWEMSQQTDMETGALKYWDDGKPRTQLIMSMQGVATGITWETNQYRQVVLPDDDGSRRLFVKGGLQSAVAKALREAKSKLEVGAYLEVTRGEDLPSKKKGFGGQHTFTAVWTPAHQNSHAATAMLGTAEDENPFG